MNPFYKISCCVLLVASLVAPALSQSKAGVLGADELKKVMPASFFYRGQSASVQMRNAVGFRANGNRFVLAALVDTSGYSTDIQEKYQGLFITEVKLKIGDSTLAPGAYGFCFKDGKFMVTDVGGGDVLSVASQNDDSITHAVPLKMTADGAGFRLYAGKKWVSLSE